MQIKIGHYHIPIRIAKIKKLTKVSISKDGNRVGVGPYADTEQREHKPSWRHTYT